MRWLLFSPTEAHELRSSAAAISSESLADGPASRGAVLAGQVSYLQGMLRTTAGVVIGLSNRQATDTSICRHFEDGSDGTRTRDLRRDRPLQVQRRLTMNRLNLCHLRGLFAFEAASRSMVA